MASQIDLHAAFGGVVPELASRAHLETITPIVERALDEAGRHRAPTWPAVAVTSRSGPRRRAAGRHRDGQGPGARLGHPRRRASTIWRATWPASTWPTARCRSPRSPCWCRVATACSPAPRAPGRYELLGETVDDSIGEAYDKVARFLGLGYPGGPVLDRLAATGGGRTLGFPRPMLAEGYAFSFSGLKTAVVNYVRANPDFSESEVAASFVAACMDVLIAKLRRALAGVRRPGPGHRRRRGGQPDPASPGPGPGRRVRDPAAHPAAVDGHRQRGDDRRGRVAEAGCGRTEPTRRSGPNPTCGCSSTERQAATPTPPMTHAEPGALSHPCDLVRVAGHVFSPGCWLNHLVRATIH